ncbi:MAG TPA: hypothetical protein DCW68_02935 [Rhodospirillaceae bacterium]|nr:MAG: hypothetical protein A2018_05910 [Alphaproteobacteria bacterium GWF2_58_20]HAU29047.1 hypothetical protein [Rhodospirillaceae bacterium]
MTDTPAFFDYETSKKMATSSNVQARETLAARPDVCPEFLYLLATDSREEVRQRIAQNSKTPRQADVLLSHDHATEVRATLAGKISHLVPDLSPDNLNEIDHLTMQVLDTLARDEAVRVRRVLSEELAHLDFAPADIINRLARDVEIEVAQPILETSRVLRDEDLLDIIQSGPIGGALESIARRQRLDEDISDCIAKSQNESAISCLLANQSAQIREETLDLLLSEAPHHQPWHDPFARRPGLSVHAITRLAHFVAQSLFEVLSAHPEIRKEEAEEIAEIVQLRMERSGAPLTDDDPELPSRRARLLARQGRLDSDMIEDAIANGERIFIFAALSIMARVPEALIEKIISSQSPQGMTALAWRAGLSPHAATQIQIHVGRIPPAKALPLASGGRWPLSESDMRWQLEFFGIKE